MFCISIDYADTITNIQKTNKVNQIPDDVIVINDSSQIDGYATGYATSDGKIYTDKSKKKKKQKKSKKKPKNTITMTGKPSCSRCARNHIPYRWYTRTYVNYCPNCHHYNCLGNKHKSGSVYEQEISCFVCDSDFCVYDGKEKYSWSHVYLRKE